MGKSSDAPNCPAQPLQASHRYTDIELQTSSILCTNHSHTSTTLTAKWLTQVQVDNVLKFNVRVCWQDQQVITCAQLPCSARAAIQISKLY